MRIHIFISIFLISGKVSIAQHAIQLSGAMEKAPTYLCNALSNEHISNARSISSADIPTYMFKQIEKHFLLLKDTTKYSFVGIPVHQMFISLNEDSLITAFRFIIEDDPKNIAILLQHFGPETPGWTSTSILSEDEPERLNHIWYVKHYCVFLSSPTTFPKEFPEYKHKIVLSISKGLDPAYLCAKRGVHKKSSACSINE